MNRKLMQYSEPTVLMTSGLISTWGALRPEGDRPLLAARDDIAHLDRATLRITPRWKVVSKVRRCISDQGSRFRNGFNEDIGCTQGAVLQKNSLNKEKGCTQDRECAVRLTSESVTDTASLSFRFLRTISEIQLRSPWGYFNHFATGNIPTS